MQLQQASYNVDEADGLVNVCAVLDRAAERTVIATIATLQENQGTAQGTTILV